MSQAVMSAWERFRNQATPEDRWLLRSAVVTVLFVACWAVVRLT